MNDFSKEELEMFEISVDQRYHRWIDTESYLRTGSAQGFTEECHKIEEAQWMCERYERLLAKLIRLGSVGVPPYV